MAPPPKPRSTITPPPWPARESSERPVVRQDGALRSEPPSDVEEADIETGRKDRRVAIVEATVRVAAGILDVSGDEAATEWIEAGEVYRHWPRLAQRIFVACVTAVDGVVRARHHER